MRDPGTVESDDTLRLFVALTLPGATVERLVAWQDAALSRIADVRPVPRENLHVTLAFLGRRPAADVERVAESLRRAAARTAPPHLRVRRYRETRSVGMLLLDDDGARAGRLAGSVHRRLERLGVYRRERRAWLPHLTVIRFRSPPGAAPELPDLGEFSPSEAAVYHSVLRPGGAQYRVLEAVALGG